MSGGNGNGKRRLMRGIPHAEDRVRGICYARFSPRRDAAETLSCEKQRDICVEYCQKMKYYHAEDGSMYFEDRALSGHEADRPGLWRAIDALGRGDRLVVRWRHRLARDVYLDAAVERAVKARGAWIEAVEDGHNADSPSDQLIRRILAAFSEYEREVVCLRTRHAMRRHMANGRYMGGRAPYGWRRDPLHRGNLVEVRTEQATIGKILDMRAAGASYYRIRNTLLETGVKPRRAAEWNYETLQGIVRREADREAVGKGRKR